jgi:hypothetical protein
VETLKKSLQKFYAKSRESVFLIETIGDRLFMSISNLYFFNFSRGKQVDFSESPNGQVPDFEDVFPIRIASAKEMVYVAW